MEFRVRIEKSEEGRSLGTKIGLTKLMKTRELLETGVQNPVL